MRRTTTRLGVAAATVLAATCGAAAIAPAQGGAPTAVTVNTSGITFVVAGGSGPNATVQAGGTVTFTNTGGSHNLNLSDASNPAGGVSCTQNGSPTGLVTTVASAPWTVVCTFTQPGTYQYWCDPHRSMGMTGQITVVAAGTTAPPAPDPTQPGTPPPPTTTQPTTTPAQVAVAGTQRGEGVHGTITRAKASSTAQIQVFATRGDLGLSGTKTTRVSVGSLSAKTTSSGGLDFVVPLSAKARSALAKRGRLALTVHVMTADAMKDYQVTLRRQATPSSATVTLKDDLFSPSIVTIRRCGSVTWRWRDGQTSHDVKAKSFRSTIKSSGTYRRSFANAGTYTYVCSLHDGMKGKVVVRR